MPRYLVKVWDKDDKTWYNFPIWEAEDATYFASIWEPDRYEAFIEECPVTFEELLKLADCVELDLHTDGQDGDIHSPIGYINFTNSSPLLVNLGDEIEFKGTKFFCETIESWSKPGDPVPVFIEYIYEFQIKQEFNGNTPNPGELIILTEGKFLLGGAGGGAGTDFSGDCG